MARFITDEVGLKRFKDENGVPSDILEVTQDNQIFQHDDGTLEYAPRFLVSDKYSRPLGNRNKFSPEPAHFHDIKCFYKERFVIDLGLEELIMQGFVHKHNSSFLKDKYGVPVKITVCEDIPQEFLRVEKVEKWQTDCDLKTMMKCVGINAFWYNFYRAGVFLNIGWFWNGKKSLKDVRPYEDLYGRKECYR